MKRKILRILLDVGIAAAVLISWGSMFFSLKNGILFSRGIASLKYYTVLSNLLLAAAALVSALMELLSLRKEHSLFSRFSAGLSHAAVSSVLLTFLTVLVFLGPRLGYGAMYMGANLWLHLILPLAGMFVFVLLNRQALDKRADFTALIPTGTYAYFYIFRLLLGGRDMLRYNDWYGFVTWGYPVGVVILLLVFFITFWIARAVRALNRGIQRRESTWQE